MSSQSGSKPYTLADGTTVRKMFFRLTSDGEVGLRAEPNTYEVQATTAQVADVSSRLSSMAAPSGLVDALSISYVADGGELGGTVDVSTTTVSWRQDSGAARVDAVTPEMIADLRSFLADPNAFIDALV